MTYERGLAYILQSKNTYVELAELLHAYDAALFRNAVMDHLPPKRRKRKRKKKKIES